MLASLGLADHSRIGLQPVGSQQREPKVSPWTIVLHPAPASASYQSLKGQVFGRSVAEINQQAKPSHKIGSHQQSCQIPEQESAGLLDHLQPASLMHTWLMHQLRLSWSLDSSKCDDELVAMGDRCIPLVSGSMLAAKLLCLGAQTIGLEDVQKPELPHPHSSNHLQPGKEIAQGPAGVEAVANQGPCIQLHFQVELVKGSTAAQKGLSSAQLPTSSAQSARNQLGSRSSFRPTPSGQEEPQETAASDSSSGPYMLVTPEQVKSGQVAVELGKQLDHSLLSGHGHSSITREGTSQSCPAQVGHAPSSTWLLPFTQQPGLACFPL